MRTSQDRKENELGETEGRETRRPEDALRAAVLSHLDGAGSWVDVIELPFPAPFGRDARRALLRAFALEGTLSLARHPTYRNLLMARITDAGRRVVRAPAGTRA